MIPKTSFTAALAVVLVFVFVSCADADPSSEEAVTASGEPSPAFSVGLGSTYLALGDSLSVGVGASNTGERSFVALVHTHLGGAVTVTNLGHGGDTSGDFIEHGHLEEAIALIEELNRDDDHSTDVALATFEIGGNDLLGLYYSAVLSGTCPDVETILSSRDCYGQLENILAGFDANFGNALDGLLAADPSLPLVVLSFYDPFSGFLPTQSAIAQLALEGEPDTRFEEGLNDIIRRHARERGLPVALVYERFQDQAPGFISGDFIHPSDAGYQAMAEAVIDVIPPQP